MKKLAYLASYVSVFFGLLSFIAFVSYDANDWAIIEGTIQGYPVNVLGRFGAIWTHQFFYLFGYAAFSLPFSFFYAPFYLKHREIVNRNDDNSFYQFLDRLSLFFIAILITLVIMPLFFTFHVASGFLDIRFTGGILGESIASLMINTIGIWLSDLILLGGLLLLVRLLSWRDLAYFKLIEQLGARVVKLSGLAAYEESEAMITNKKKNKALKKENPSTEENTFLDYTPSLGSFKMEMIDLLKSKEAKLLNEHSDEQILKDDLPENELSTQAFDQENLVQEMRRGAFESQGLETLEMRTTLNQSVAEELMRDQDNRTSEESNLLEEADLAEISNLSEEIDMPEAHFEPDVEDEVQSETSDQTFNFSDFQTKEYAVIDEESISKERLTEQSESINFNSIMTDQMGKVDQIDLPEESLEPLASLEETQNEAVDSEELMLDDRSSEESLTYQQSNGLDTADINVALTSLYDDLEKQSNNVESVFEQAALTLPGIDCLGAEPDHLINEEQDDLMLLDYSRRLEACCKEFGIDIKVKDVIKGPVIMQFRIQLAPGVKVSKLSTVEKDIARIFMVSSLRILDVLPGSPYVGIEVPNENRATISFQSIVCSDAFQHNDHQLSLALGQTITGEPYVADLTKMPHLMIAGTTGSGKSVGVNALLLGLLIRYYPSDVRMVLIDPKMLELNLYQGIPHLLMPVISDANQSVSALQWLVSEMDRRYLMMSQASVRNIESFNAKIESVKNDSTDDIPIESAGKALSEISKIPYIVVVIDELADLMISLGKRVEEPIIRIAQKARAAGIHLILATQRPSVDVITGLIKANTPSRAAYLVSSKIDSRTILDQSGAEKLLGKGDMLFSGMGDLVPNRLHGPWVSDDMIETIVAHWRAFQIEDHVYLPNQQEKDKQTSFSAKSKELDSLYQEVLDWIYISELVPSISSVQRKFQIGFNRAARIIEQLEEKGIISKADNRGRRQLL